MERLSNANRLIIISADKSEAFIKKFNESKMDDNFKKSCEKAGKLFKTK